MTEEASFIKLMACIRADPTLLFISFINVKHFYYPITLLGNSCLQLKKKTKQQMRKYRFL